MKFFIALILISACSTKPAPSICPDATVTVDLPKAEAKKIEGNVSRFLTDAKIIQEHMDEGKNSLWRFSNMPEDSVYYLIGLREGDAIYKTNLGMQTSGINLISDLAGIPSGTTNCLYVKAKDNSDRVIKILVIK